MGRIPTVHVRRYYVYMIRLLDMNMIIGLLCTIYTVLMCCTVLDCTLCNGIGIGFGVTRHITMPLLAPYAQAKAIQLTGQNTITCC